MAISLKFERLKMFKKLLIWSGLKLPEQSVNGVPKMTGIAIECDDCKTRREMTIHQTCSVCGGTAFSLTTMSISRFPVPVTQYTQVAKEELEKMRN